MEDGTYSVQLELQKLAQIKKLFWYLQHQQDQFIGHRNRLLEKDQDDRLAKIFQEQVATIFY